MPSYQSKATILVISQLTLPLFTGICAKVICKHETLHGSARDRYTLIEQSPNYSNRTFNGIISFPYYTQLIHTNTYINQQHESIWNAFIY